MRHNYDTHGVDGYYAAFGADYKNPHDAPLRKALGEALTKWYTAHKLSFAHTLDLACGSGESTLALLHWCRRAGLLPPAAAPPPAAAGGGGDKDGGADGGEGGGVGGSARGTRASASALAHVEGADPYTYEAYQKRVGCPAERFSFQDVQAGHLEGRRYSLVLSSFALHLLTTKSQLWATILQLSFVTRHLIVITPHKRPELSDNMGFSLLDEVRAERVRVRLYRSNNFAAADDTAGGSGSGDLRQGGWAGGLGVPSGPPKDGGRGEGGDRTATRSQVSPDVAQNVSVKDRASMDASAPAALGDDTSSMAARLTAFWKEHAPDKVANVARVLANYHGHEEVLVQRLERKYQAQFPPPPPPPPPPPLRLAAPTGLPATTPATTSELSTPEVAAGSSSLALVQRLHAQLYPPEASTAAAHSLSDAERTATQSLAVKSLTYGEIRVDSFYELLCARVLERHAFTCTETRAPASTARSSAAGEELVAAARASAQAPRRHELNFMDLGSGTGAAVFAAALSFPFRRCSGIEILSSLHQRAVTAQSMWCSDAAFRAHLPSWALTTEISLRCGDLATAAAELADTDIGFANSTLFDPPLMARLAATAGGMAVGALFVTFSKDLPCAHWQVLERYQAMMSWGVCVVIIQRKLAPGHAPARPGDKFYSNRDDHTYAPEGDSSAFLNAIVATAAQRGAASTLPAAVASVGRGSCPVPVGSQEGGAAAAAGASDDCAAFTTAAAAATAATAAATADAAGAVAALVATERRLREVLARVWPASSATQVKVMQKLKRCGVGSVEALREALGNHLLSSTQEPAAADADPEAVAVNIALRVGGYRIFGAATLLNLRRALLQAREPCEGTGPP